MIPKPLNEIEWSDIEALRDIGREEDDMIEFKGSFSGGADFTAFNEKQQATAVDGIAKEAIAFLNGRGGDVIIGASEFKNDHPKIESLTPIANATAVADRLAQALSAIIEPVQTVLNVRAILQSPPGDLGIIVVRVQSSLRAPHRSRRTKDCFIRRGRESVSMPMDEVQDLTIRRADLRRERFELMFAQFSDFASDRVGRSTLSRHRFHIRTVFLPMNEPQITIDSQLCALLNGPDPALTQGDKNERIDVPFRYLSNNWFPILRGKRIEVLRPGGWSEDDFFFSAKEIKENGIFRVEFGCRISIGKNEHKVNGLFFNWIAGFAANAISCILKLVEKFPELGEGFLRTGIYCDGEIVAVLDQGHYGDKHYVWPRETVFLPDSVLPSVDGVNEWLMQTQIDVASIGGFEFDNPYKFAEA